MVCCRLRSQLWASPANFVLRVTTMGYGVSVVEACDPKEFICWNLDSECAEVVGVLRSGAKGRWLGRLKGAVSVS